MSKSPLLDKVREVIRLRHYSIRTEEAYVQTMRRFILYHRKRHPREMGVDEIRQYLSHLATDGNVAASTQNVALCALLFSTVRCCELICHSLREHRARETPEARAGCFADRKSWEKGRRVPGHR
jgi:hypothetical protein